MSQLNPSHFRQQDAYDDVDVLRAHDRVEIQPIRLLPILRPGVVEAREELFPPLPEPMRLPRPLVARRASEVVAAASWTPAAGTRSDGDSVVVCFDLPGVSATSLRVVLVGESLEVWFEIPRSAG